MFDHSHYVPVLRWKLAERNALRDLFPSVKSGLSPLIEVPPQEKYPQSIRHHRGESPFFFDFGPLMANASQATIINFFNNAREWGLFAVPTTGLARSQGYQKAIASTVAVDRRGVCIRLSRQELNDVNLRLSLENLLKELEQQVEDVDLIIDLKVYWEGDSNLLAILSRVPEVKRWRSLTLVSGSFPANLTGFRVGQYELPRSEWLAWLSALNKQSLQRIPTFGDYTIIHPYLTEFKPGMNISASIRYTAWDYWVVMRGEGLKNPGGPGYAQYPANAEMLTMRPEFRGTWFSTGDRYISEIAEKRIRTGNPSTWLQAGINHHLSFTADQMIKVFGSTAYRLR